MCTHIQYTGSQNTTIQWYYYVFYIIEQNATTCFSLYGPSSGCWENLNREVRICRFLHQTGRREILLF
jgi:hypothetical protein